MEPEASDLTSCKYNATIGFTSENYRLNVAVLLSICVRGRHVPSTGFLNAASALNQYSVLPLNGSNYYLIYTLKAVHVLGILCPAHLISQIHAHQNQQLANCS